MKDVGLVAWKIPRALLRALREDILLVSLLFLSISEGLIEIITILMRRARMAITMRSSIKVKDFMRLARLNLTKEDLGGVKELLFFSCLMSFSMILDILTFLRM